MYGLNKKTGGVRLVEVLSSGCFCVKKPRGIHTLTSRLLVTVDQTKRVYQFIASVKYVLSRLRAGFVNTAVYVVPVVFFRSKLSVVRRVFVFEIEIYTYRRQTIFHTDRFIRVSGERASRSRGSHLQENRVNSSS